LKAIQFGSEAERLSAHKREKEDVAKIAGFSDANALEVPLSFAPGEAYQFDWSHEIVLINGVTGHGEGRACPALPQPHAVCSGLSARDAGDGVRRP
jgi:hypothetical protein